MTGQQGDLALLNDPIAQTLLQSTIPARLAYSWTDGTPRVVPIWFHWTGEEFVLGSPPGAPKLKALAANSAAALTIDENAWPPKVLLVRGSATVQLLEDLRGCPARRGTSAAAPCDQAAASSFVGVTSVAIV
jgi:nitroimidazol reductase NimA-like FMN-containing flavoprotein (pyridoxamine 5'-phosphate oxidase superfamily)